MPRHASDQVVSPYAINAGITVAITEIRVEGGGPGQQLKVGDSVSVSGTWDATTGDRAPLPGDEFSVAFPAELEIPNGQTLQLLGDDTVWGTCVVSQNTMNCTLTDAVTDRPDDVKGTFTLFSRAVAYTTAAELPFRVNGQVTVDGRLPGGGGISDGQDLGPATKSGALQPDKAAVRWTIDIPGSALIALDSAGTGQVSLPDTLSSNMQLCEAGRLTPTLQSGRPGALTAVPNGAAVTQPGGAGTPVTIGITNGSAFRADQVYRIQYTTCTTSGQVDIPEAGGAPVVYDNSVTIGDAVVGAVGVGQDWRPAVSPSKSGSLPGGNSRYGTLNWTIMVPGSFIAANADHAVTIRETLQGDHAVCAQGLAPTITRGNYLPGANGQAPGRTNVTGQFTVAHEAEPGATGFDLSFVPDDIEAFDPEKYYYVNYSTCITTGQVPDNGDSFGNTAMVNTSPVGATVRGPSFSSSKNGTLNTTARELAGQIQPAGTTIDWAVEIPGRHLEDVTEPAVLTDTFSESLTVCQAGDDLKQNLGLRVTARDFLGAAGVNPERDLTADTTVVRDGNQLTLTLPRDADAGDYSRELRYRVDYTLCTASGGLDARGTTYGNTIGYYGRELTQSVRQTWGGGGTGQGVNRGSFSLSKSLDRRSEDVPEDTTYSVRVEEFAPGVDPATESPEASYTVQVRAGDDPVSGRNSRGSGWTIRLTEIAPPATGGVYFGPGRFSPAAGVTLNDDRTQALITLQPRTNVAVELVNRAFYGSATVTKRVVGDAVGELTGTESYVVHAAVDLDGDGPAGAEIRPFTLTDGGFYELTGLPIGAHVTFTEVPPADTDRITWSAPVFEPQRLVIGADAAANAVTLTNTATITQGTLSVTKELAGPQASNAAVPSGFEVLATWTDAEGAPQEKTLTVPADGTPVELGEDLPGGTEVTLTETVPANGNGLAWSVPAFRGDVTVDTPGSAVVTVGQQLRQATVRNVVDTNDGTLRLTKQVSGEAAEAAGDTEFRVEARWREGTVFRTTQLTVGDGEVTPLGVELPVGTEVTFRELDRPEIDGVEWGSISWGTDPEGEQWLAGNPDGTATGIVSDDPNEGRLITLTNEALWQPGSIEFAKYIFDGSDPVAASDADLPPEAEFQVRIDGIDPPLPQGTDFPALGEVITLDAANDWAWRSGADLPRGTVITFSEVDPDALPGMDWARPFYYVAADAGEPGDRDTVEIAAGDEAVVEIRNRPVPTAEVDVVKTVTGPKGARVARDPSTSFQVTATWTDADEVERSCILQVVPGQAAVPTAACEATVIGGKVYFPRDTEIEFVETGATTDVPNVSWGEIRWDVESGGADVTGLENEPAGATVVFTGDAGDPVALGLENRTSSRGLIILPLPIPLPPFGGGSVTGPNPGSDDPVTPGGPSDPGTPGGPSDPGTPGDPNRPLDPSTPNDPTGLGKASTVGHAGEPGVPAPGASTSGGALANTGADVRWLAGAAAVMILGGALALIRSRRNGALHTPDE
ncbi:DUF5979 domain-containing protein [Dietzia sp. SLG310A2-38A2]|uniref:DUF5979 domain-containing protein n=1 Tax=Dietzia sp. SLG310A2-38A2 TaxID=1630643 RepID=UPI0016569109